MRQFLFADLQTCLMQFFFIFGEILLAPYRTSSHENQRGTYRDLCSYPTPLSKLHPAPQTPLSPTRLLRRLVTHAVYFPSLDMCLAHIVGPVLKAYHKQHQVQGSVFLTLEGRLVSNEI